MKKILISPYSKKLSNGNKNPKNYPYFNELVDILKKEKIIVYQTGIDGEEKLKNVDYFFKNLKIMNELKNVVESCDIVICVDNFMNHLLNYIGKKGIVVFSRSDPEIFGYKSNINLLKDRKFLCKDQFLCWESQEYINEAFISPEKIFETVKSVLFN